MTQPWRTVLPAPPPRLRNSGGRTQWVVRASCLHYVRCDARYDDGQIRPAPYRVRCERCPPEPAPETTPAPAAQAPEAPQLAERWVPAPAQRPKKLTPQQIATLAEAYRGGAGIGPLAKRAGMSKASFREVLADAGVAIRKPGHPVEATVLGSRHQAASLAARRASCSDPANWGAFAAAAYLDGAYPSDIARAFAAPESAVRRELKHAGVTTRPGRPSTTDKATPDHTFCAAVNAHNKGATIDEIAETANVSTATVKVWLESVGAVARADPHQPVAKPSRGGVRVRSGAETRYHRPDVLARIAEMADAYQRGATLAQVGEMVGVSAGVAGRRLREAGVQLRAGARSRYFRTGRDDIVAQMADAYQRGATLAEAGRIGGVSGDTAKRWIAEASAVTETKEEGTERG